MRVIKEEGEWKRAEALPASLLALKNEKQMMSLGRVECLESKDPAGHLKALLWAWDGGAASAIIHEKEKQFWVEAWEDEKKESFFECTGPENMLDAEDTAEELCLAREEFMQGEEALLEGLEEKAKNDAKPAWESWGVEKSEEDDWKRRRF